MWQKQTTFRNTPNEPHFTTYLSLASHKLLLSSKSSVKAWFNICRLLSPQHLQFLCTLHAGPLLYLLRYFICLSLHIRCFHSIFFPCLNVAWMDLQPLPWLLLIVFLVLPRTTATGGGCTGHGGEPSSSAAFFSRHLLLPTWGGQLLCTISSQCDKAFSTGWPNCGTGDRCVGKRTVSIC